MVRKSRHKKNIIDLHGVRHHDVLEILERSLLGYQNISENGDFIEWVSIPDTEGWEIITGNSVYMIEIVEEFLRKNLFRYYRTSDNYGRIILAH